MITFVCGGVRSGKSQFAEDLLSDEVSGKVYVATARCYDDEMRSRVIKHQLDRKDKGFRTIEQPLSLGQMISEVSPGDVVLLECLTNLVANTMFELQLDLIETTELIFEDIKALGDRVKRLVIVSNDLFSDGDHYSPETLAYMESLGTLHQLISREAGEVYELVYGISIRRK